MNNSSFKDTAGSVIEMSRPDTFDRIFRLYHAIMCSFSERIVGSSSDAEDIVEEVFLQLWDKKSIFNNEEHIRFFLYRAVRNASLNRLKSVQRTTEKHQLGSNESATSLESHLYQIIRSEILLNIYQEIDKLPPQEKKVITLNLLEDKKLQEIADELGLSLQSIKNYKSRALAKLRLRLPKDSYLLLITLLLAS